MFHIHPNRSSLRKSFFAVVILLVSTATSPLSLGQEKAGFVFKPADTSLALVFQQMAGSLEHYGTPVPYLRHILAEHERIEALYYKKKGKKPRSYKPDWLTTEYIAKLEKNWAKLSPKLGLDGFARRSGKRINAAIDSENSFVIELCNAHQKQVFEKMVGRGKGNPNYAKFREEFLARLKSDSVIDHQARVEFALTASQSKAYRRFLAKPRIERSDFPALEKFYKNGYDNLTDLGKSRMSRRVWDGTRKKPPNPITEDQASYRRARAELKAIEKDMQAIFARLEKYLPEQDASQLKDWLQNVVDVSCEAAESEIRTAIAEWAFNDYARKGS